MAKVIIALGSNLDNPLFQLQKAGAYLETISDKPIQKSPIYTSEPLGPSEHDFLNAVAVIDTNLDPASLFEQLKLQEQEQGRPSRYPKWTARTLDLDIIAYDDLVLHTDSLIIPHNEYTKRLFVLLPLKDVFSDWQDPSTAQHIDDLIVKADKLEISKTDLNW